MSDKGNRTNLRMNISRLLMIVWQFLEDACHRLSSAQATNAKMLFRGGERQDAVSTRGTAFQELLLKRVKTPVTLDKTRKTRILADAIG